MVADMLAAAAVAAAAVLLIDRLERLRVYEPPLPLGTHQYSFGH
jgi:hypothetical protein